MCEVVIAQINPHVPFSYGDALIHVSKLTAAVEVDEPLVELPTAQPSEIDRKIGGYIAELIPDGATLQIGVGAFPTRYSQPWAIINTWDSTPKHSPTE